MDWYYVINDRRYGPVSESRLEELRRAGEVHDDTLVWRKGFADWKPMHAASAEAAANDRLCAECRKFFPQSEMINLNRAWICMQCKPLFLQRLSEGAAPSAGVGQLWRDGRLLVFHFETTFPDRCINCNRPANGYRLKCDVQWAPTGRFVLSRRRYSLHAGLCARHRAHRRWALFASGIAVVVGIGMIVFGSVWNDVVAGCGVPVILISLVTVAHFSSPFAAMKVKDQVIWLRGTGKAFLADLPEWTRDR